MFAILVEVFLKREICLQFLRVVIHLKKERKKNTHKDHARNNILERKNVSLSRSTNVNCSRSLFISYVEFCYTILTVGLHAAGQIIVIKKSLRLKFLKKKKKKKKEKKETNKKDRKKVDKVVSMKTTN